MTMAWVQCRVATAVEWNLSVGSLSLLIWRGTIGIEDQCFPGGHLLSAKHTVQS